MTYVVLLPSYSHIRGIDKSSSPSLILTTYIYFKNFIGVRLIYNVVLVSGVQIHLKVNLSCKYIYLLFFGFFSYIGHYRVLSRVPCAIQ